MISVIIPVLNESETIADMVEFAWRGPGVSEVIVIDDGSIDGSPEVARSAGANICLLKAAGISVAFQPKSVAVRQAASHVAVTTLEEILDVFQEKVVLSA